MPSYSAFGLTLRSDLPLPGLVPEPTELADPALQIVLASPPPDALAGAVLFGRSDDAAGGFFGVRFAVEDYFLQST